MKVAIIVTSEGVERTQIYGDKNRGFRLVKLIENQIDQIDSIVKEKIKVRKRIKEEE